jgi:arabinofuranan 3-O-arabinosyltransferase
MSRALSDRYFGDAFTISCLFNFSLFRYRAIIHKSETPENERMAAYRDGALMGLLTLIWRRAGGHAPVSVRARSIRHRISYSRRWSSEALFHRRSPRLLGIFAAWRLRAYSGAVAVIYAFVFCQLYRFGGWVISSSGGPIYSDFSTAWVVGVQALQGQVAPLYDPAKFLEIQTALLGAQKFFYPNWPYPPIFSLVMAPFGLLPYFWSFVTWTSTTLLGCIAVVYMIVRRSPAIPLVLASPFTLWNILAGQNGFLTASLLGASLLFLERQPALAGVFIGLLTYKPQFGILLPVALAAAKQWRAVASAVATAALFAAASLAAFGASAWQAFPRGLFQQFGVVFEAEGLPDSAATWGYLQTVYGLIRYLHGGAALAWLGQGITALCAAVIVWLVWRSPARYALKAAILSTLALLASPYAFAYDMAAIAIPVAFLARDQMRCGVLRGEQTILLGLFCATLALLVIFRDPPDGIPFGSLPGIGPAVLMALSIVILRRTFWRAWDPGSAW